MTYREIWEPERGQRVPVRLWARSISTGTARQLQRLASRPYVVEFVAAMADAHLSEGVSVGTVFATEGSVVPAALGCDLGCGMSASSVGDATTLDRRTLERVIDALDRAIPTGDALHRGRGAGVPDALLAPALSTNALERTRDALAPRHLGTLGGGNHFLELDRDADGRLWLLVHSGSRGLGAAIAAHHGRVLGADAASLPAMDVATPEGAAYLNDVGWASSFARANREALRARALEVLGQFVPLDVGEATDVHHNFVQRERWFGRDLLVHRKGAIAARASARALIPGSMGTASYLVRGLGNPDAFGSCSHGAGRVLSRKEARAVIRPAAFERSMHRIVMPRRARDRLIEEAPAAYRDIGEVLDAQRDLVVRERRLEPMAVLKG